jgi:uncharacterized protein YgfB (UPF0149 family)
MQMAAPSLPDFERTLRLGRGDLDAAGLAESHGLLCGLVCRQASDSAGDYLRHLSAMRLVTEPGEALNEALTEAWRSTVAQFEDEDLGFTLWLPDDDDPLEERALALARWCSGFLAGLGSGGQLEALSEEALEAIGDLQEIARAELSAPAADESRNEDDEAAYAEIVEYVRIVALVLREDFRGPQENEAIH